MIYIVRPIIFFGIVSVLFIWGNGLNQGTLPDWSSTFLLLCLLLLVFGWYFAPARVIWLFISKRGEPSEERLVKRNQIIGWTLSWFLISTTFLIASRTHLLLPH